MTNDDDRPVCVSVRLLIEGPEDSVHVARSLRRKTPDPRRWIGAELSPGTTYHLTVSAGEEAVSLTRRRPAPGTAHVLLEVLAMRSRPILLAATCGAARVRIDGLAAPRLAMLRLAQVLQVVPRVSIFVTYQRRALIEKPTGEQLTMRCGVCTDTFSEDLPVVACAACGLVVHAETAVTVPSDVEPRECAFMGDCPDCGSALPVRSGYSWLPEGFDTETADAELLGGAV